MMAKCSLSSSSQRHRWVQIPDRKAKEMRQIPADYNRDSEMKEDTKNLLQGNFIFGW